MTFFLPDRYLSMLEQNLKGQYRKLTWIIPVAKREISVKGIECSELCDVMYVKPSILKSHAGE